MRRVRGRKTSHGVARNIFNEKRNNNGIFDWYAFLTKNFPAPFGHDYNKINYCGVFILNGNGGSRFFDYIYGFPYQQYDKIFNYVSGSCNKEFFYPYIHDLL